MILPSSSTRPSPDDLVGSYFFCLTSALCGLLVVRPGLSIHKRWADPGTSAILRHVCCVDAAVVFGSVLLDFLPHLLDAFVEGLVGPIFLVYKVVGIVCRLVGWATRLREWCGCDGGVRGLRRCGERDNAGVRFHGVHCD